MCCGRVIVTVTERDKCRGRLSVSTSPNSTKIGKCVWVIVKKDIWEEILVEYNRSDGRAGLDKK